MAKRTRKQPTGFITYTLLFKSKTFAQQSSKMNEKLNANIRN